MKKITLLFVFACLTMLSCEQFESSGITKIEETSSIAAQPYGNQWTLTISYSFSRSGTISNSSYSSFANTFWNRAGNIYLGHAEDITFSTNLNLCTSPSNFANKTLSFDPNCSPYSIWRGPTYTGPWTPVTFGQVSSSYYTSNGFQATVGLVHLIECWAGGWFASNCDIYYPCTLDYLELDYDFSA